MSYLVLARKWRPKTFSEVVGQQHVLRALINGLDQDRLHHAFLFAGTRGVGKTTLARILAKSLNCEQGVSSTPCGECQSCQEVDAGRFVDLIEVDAASRTKVDDTRELLDNVQYAPSRGRYKVYLIDEVHMLSTSSFNALLKTLEEPPPHVKFLLATTDPQKLPVTILSRCLQFNLRRLELDQISGHLANILQQENIKFESGALTELARSADGSMRDALSLLDQAISFGAGEVTSEHVHQMLGTINQHQLFHIVTALLNQDGKALLDQAQELSAQGRDFTSVLNALLALLQRLATVQLVPDLEQTSDDEQQLLTSISTQISPETVQLLYQIALHGKRDLPLAADPKSGFEMTLLRMLSFQPQKSETMAVVTPVNKPVPTSLHGVKPTAIAEVDAAPEPPVSYKKTVLASPKPATQIAEMPSIPAQAAPKNEAPITANQTSGTTLNANNWLSVIASLKLAAFSRQLADNSAFIKFEDNKVTLAIASELAHLSSDKTQDRLATALGKYLDQTIKLVFQQEAQQDTVPATPTLAAERAHQTQLSQKHAVDSIHNDPAVNELKQAFNGRVIESTIKPLD
ncbi:MAG: DNA polymerase-3 subunit gamma/tau [Methylophagaceae bacterium]|jgi:DNA polymerase-3 subunit gamma/tau